MRRQGNFHNDMRTNKGREYNAGTQKRDDQGRDGAEHLNRTRDWGRTSSQRSPEPVRVQRNRDITPERDRRELTPDRGRRSLTPDRGLRNLTPERGRRDFTPERGRRSLTPERGRRRDLTPDRRRDFTPDRGRRDLTPNERQGSSRDRDWGRDQGNPDGSSISNDRLNDNKPRQGYSSRSRSRNSSPINQRSNQMRPAERKMDFNNNSRPNFAGQRSPSRNYGEPATRSPDRSRGDRRPNLSSNQGPRDERTNPRPSQQQRVALPDNRALGKPGGGSNPRPAQAHGDGRAGPSQQQHENRPMRANSGGRNDVPRQAGLPSPRNDQRTHYETLNTAQQQQRSSTAFVRGTAGYSDARRQPARREPNRQASAEQAPDKRRRVEGATQATRKSSANRDNAAARLSGSEREKITFLESLFADSQPEAVPARSAAFMYLQSLSLSLLEEDRRANEETVGPSEHATDTGGGPT